MKVLVKGGSGLLGSEAVEHFDRQGHEVVGVDNKMLRADSNIREQGTRTRAQHFSGTHGR
jgi:nucleoside-diphosphate-sugar epimerase